MAVIVRKLFTRPFLIAVLICIFVFYSGLFSFKEKNPAVFIFKSQDINLVCGKILSSPVKTSTGSFYSCQFRLTAAGSSKEAWGSAKGDIKLFIPSQLIEALYPGKIYSFAEEITSNTNSLLFESGLKAAFTGSYKEGSFFAETCQFSFWPKGLFSSLSHFRALCRLTFKRLLYAWGNAGGLLLALLTASRDFTEKEISDAFRNAGLSHILALSGMHLSLFSSLAIFAGKKTGSIRLSYLLRILVISLFVWFAGFSPSLLRAFICAMLVILAAIAAVPKLSTFDILTLSFLIQSSIAPSHIHNPGFLLSYGALAGITLFSSLLFKASVSFLPSPLASNLSASIAAQSLTAPVSLKLFGSFCPIGIIATMIVSPLVTFFIYAGLSLILLSMIFPIFQIASGIFMNFLYTVIKIIVLFFSGAPFISIHH